MIDAGLVRSVVASQTVSALWPALSSTSVRDARAALTRFSTELVISAALLPDDGAVGGRTVHASFKGNPRGRGARGGGGLGLKEFASDLANRKGVAFRSNEFLVDFLVSDGEDPLNVVLTAESEATPITAVNGTRDFDKLLLVRSPVRLYVGRVNVTATGKARKLVDAESILSDRLTLARDLGHVQFADIVAVVLLKTGVSRPAFYLAEAREGSELGLRRYTFPWGPLDEDWRGP